MSQKPTWIATKQAAVLLDRSTAQVLYLATAGHIRSKMVGNRRWHRRVDVVRLATDRELWISIPRAADLVGCSRSAIRRAVVDGGIEQRSLSRRNPSLQLASVHEFALLWKRQQADARENAAAIERYGMERRALSAPPPSTNGDVWLDRQTAALVLRISTGHLHRMSQQEKVPAVRVGRRFWFRRDHMERLRAAWSFRQEILPQ